MKASDLREKSVEDLRELQASLARDTFQNRLKNFTNRLDDTSLIRKTKKDLARVITLLRERNAAPQAAPVREPAEAKLETAVAVDTPEVAAAPKKKKSAKKSEAKQS